MFNVQRIFYGFLVITFGLLGVGVLNTLHGNHGAHVILQRTIYNVNRLAKTYNFSSNSITTAVIRDHQIQPQTNVTSVLNRNIDTNGTDSKLKVILLWNSYWASPDYGMGFGTRAFRGNWCKEQRCTLQNDHKLLNQAAAVIFHIGNKVEQFPRHANERQLFAYYMREPPPQTRLRPNVSEYNLTMTYSMESDIPVPYGLFDKLDTVKQEKYSLKYPLSSKNGSIAWMVSHCKTQSKREDYAAALAKHIPVDIYGKCGPYSCPKTEQGMCFEKLESQYKFYLSFENSFCSDYVTEKYFRILRLELIPIVYGRVDYDKIGIPGSYINILDYRSPKHLSDYLHYLASNETAYAEYFQYKQYYKDKHHIPKRAACKLCELVHDPTFEKTYTDVNLWHERTCDIDTVDKLMATLDLP